MSMRCKALIGLAAITFALALPAGSSAETGWPTAWWPKRLASLVFRQHFDVDAGRCHGTGPYRTQYGFRLFHRFMCSSLKLPHLYQVRALKPRVIDGNWQYRIVVELTITD